MSFGYHIASIRQLVCINVIICACMCVCVSDTDHVKINMFMDIHTRVYLFVQQQTSVFSIYLQKRELINARNT